MSKQETGDNKSKRGLTRRKFLKLSAAAGVGATMLEWADWTFVKPNPAVAAEVAKTTISTCPYCAVSCNMVVATDAAGNVVDIYGDEDNPINRGKLCSKGSAAVQLVNNNRRLGVPDSIHAASDPLRGNPGPMKRVGNDDWAPISWDQVMAEIAAAMTTARGAVPTDATGKVTGSAKGVAFLGSSHATNEENWLYRKIIANFGTNNIEHQARI